MSDDKNENWSGFAVFLFVIFAVVGVSNNRNDLGAVAFCSALLALLISGVVKTIWKTKAGNVAGTRTEIYVHRTETVYVEKTVYVDSPVDERPTRLTPYREISTPRYWDYPEIGGENYGIETKRLEGRGRNPRLR